MIPALRRSETWSPGNVLKEMATELVAGFGSTILVLAVFGLVFRTGLEQLLRGTSGGETLARSVERLESLLQGADAQDLEAQEPRLEAKMDRIGRDVRFLSDGEIPALRKEVAELRGMLVDLRQERND